ncbi:MAG TPA: Fur family transcriptional regulator [Thermomicrobiaceae bacterium]|nr:Fur family transcriptional regulator [Thermomicrobiaceae bacterium]
MSVTEVRRENVRAPIVAPDEVLAALRAYGIRVTQPRRTVVAEVCRRAGVFSADDVYHALERAGAGVGRATVFRTLDVLVGAEALGRVHRPDGAHGYVLHHPGHRHHVTCSSCGAVAEFEGCDLGALAEDLARRTHFRIEGHWLEFFGCCPDCQRAGADAAS